MLLNPSLMTPFSLMPFINESDPISGRNPPFCFLPALMTPLPVVPFTTKEFKGCTTAAAKGASKAPKIHLAVFYFLFYYFNNTIN